MNLAAQFFKVLADEARLKILWLLFSHPELPRFVDLGTTSPMSPVANTVAGAPKA